MPAEDFAPSFAIPERDIVAVEHPMVVKNVDNGLKTFGKAWPFKELLASEDADASLPLYLRPTDPSCAPIMSHNTFTNNVLLKITVPRRTGRKRKRGSEDPYAFQSLESEEKNQQDAVEVTAAAPLRTQSRPDDPKELLQTLKDNVGSYKVEAVGTVEKTHRYRGMADFHYSTNGPFMTQFKDNLVHGNLQSMKEFKFDPSRGVKPNEELIPPPRLTDKTIPFNWNYAQNPSIKVTSDPVTGTRMLNHTHKPKPGRTIFLGHNTKHIPTEPLSPPPDNSPALLATIKLLLTALKDRPIFSRRALTNHLARVSPRHLPQIKPAIQYVGYHFRGGPWRDAVIRFGLDPRTDPQYRKYQTLFFKTSDRAGTSIDADADEDADTGKADGGKRASCSNIESHLFDGKSLSTDGSIWQLCDISDPILASLIASPNLRAECDIESDGWYRNGTMAKIKAIMRTKIGAIRIGREMGDEEFEKALAVPDEVKGTRAPNVPVPEWKIEEGEGADEVVGRVGEDAVKKKRMRGRGRMTGIVRARRDSEGLRRSESAVERGGEAIEEQSDVHGTPVLDGGETPIPENDPTMDDGEEDEDSETSRSDEDEEDGEGDDDAQDEDMEVDIDDEPAYGFGGYDSDGVPIEY